MLINTTNINQQRAIKGQLRGTYPLILWLGAALFLNPMPTLDEDSKPQVRKEVYKNFAVKDSIQTLQQYTITEYNIFGKVIQFTDYQIDEKGKTTVEQNTLHKYDQLGNRIGTMKYSGNGDLLWSEEVLFDEQGRKNRVNSATYSPIRQYSYSLHAYDGFGNENSVKVFTDKDQQTSEIQRNYNEEGELLEWVQWLYVMEDGKLVKKNIHGANEFNELGQLIRSSTETQIGRNKWKQVQFFENGYLSEWLKYENGKLTSQFKHQKRDTVSVEQQYEIPPPIPFGDPLVEPDDAKRDPLALTPHTPVSMVTLKHDQSGNIIKKVVREFNEVVLVSYFDYDELNNLIYVKKIDKKTEDTEEIFRTYDHHRNITKEKIMMNGNVVSESSFEYEYYE